MCIFVNSVRCQLSPWSLSSLCVSVQPKTCFCAKQSWYKCRICLTLSTKSKELGDISSYCYSFLFGPSFSKVSLEMVHETQEVVLHLSLDEM